MNLYSLFLISFLILCCTATSSLSTKQKKKIIIFAPDIANSQIVYNARVAEILAKAGHDVTLTLFNPYVEQDTTVKIDPLVTVKRINASTGIHKSDMDKLHSEFIYQDVPIWDSRMIGQTRLFTDLLAGMCKEIITNNEFYEWIVKEKFDIAILYMYHACPVGIVHRAKIPSWIWLNSGMLMDPIADMIGVPTISSYVPPMMMAAHDRMNFIERTKSYLGHTLQAFLFRPLVTDKETALWREHIDPNFPDIYNLARQCPLIMVNTNDLYQLPRPTLAKVINIGGIGMQQKDAKPLPADLDALFKKSEGVILMSFGSVAPAEHMPDTWKASLLETFSRFPKHQFLLRYTKDDMNDRLPPNVKLAKWLPQRDILQHPKTKVFITHCGYNSLQETITAGKPMLAIPLFGDQPKNSMIATKHGFARVLLKTDVANPDAVEAALKELLNNPKYSKKAERMKEMVSQQPIAPEQLLIRWTEFAATFKTLENMEPAGQHLNIIQYYSIDIAAFLFTIVFLILFTTWKILKCVFTICFCSKKKNLKSKKE